MSRRDPEPLAASAHSGAGDPDESAIPREAVALEIEPAAFLHADSVAGMSCAGILVVSDTARHTLRDDRLSRGDRIVRVFRAIRGLRSESPPF